MKPGMKLVPVAIGAYILFLVMSAPAAKLIPYFQSQLQGVQLAGISGTLWSGKAAQLSVTPVQLTQVSWSFKPLTLLLGAVEFQLDAQLGGRALSASAGRSLLSGAYLSDVSGSVTAANLMHWVGLGMVELDGHLDFVLDEVEFSAGAIPAVAGQLAWKPALVLAPLELNLGLAELTTTIESGGITSGQLVTNGGALTLQGVVTLQPDGQYQLTGDVKKTGVVPPAVDTFLSTFAELKNGSYQLEWADQLIK